MRFESPGDGRLRRATEMKEHISALFPYRFAVRATRERSHAHKLDLVFDLCDLFGVEPAKRIAVDEVVLLRLRDGGVLNLNDVVPLGFGSFDSTA